MAKLADLKKELSGLVKEGFDLAGKLADNGDQMSLSMAYHSWYSRALEVVKIFLPDRLAEFTSLHRPDKRKQIDVESYGMADYVMGMSASQYGRAAFDPKAVAATKLVQQIGILRAVLDKLDSLVANLRDVLQADLFDRELDAAGALAKAGHGRAAGMLAGVVLERHLASVTASHNVATRKKAPSISDYNDLLKEAGVLDVPQWRLIQRLGDIRNLCAHAKDRDPTAGEVQDLINGAEKVTKELF